MSEPTNHWKLGLFVLSGFCLGVGALFVIGTIGLSDQAYLFHTFVDESVTGLEQGSAARFRGVAIGEVSAIQVAPDGRHVEIQFEVAEENLARLGWHITSRAQQEVVKVPSGLRAQLESQGVTGMKYLELDYFDAQRYPASPLPFETPTNTIPSTPSTFTSLKDSVLQLAGELPKVASRSRQTLESVRAMVEDIRAQDLPTKTATVLDRLDESLANLDGKLRTMPLGQLTRDVQATAASADDTLEEVRALLAHLQHDEGLLASLQRTSDAVGDMTGRANGMGYELATTLTQFRELTETLQSFVDNLERDPDMLFKGRAEIE